MMRKAILLIVVLLFFGCTNATYKDASYTSLFKGAVSVEFRAADGTAMIVKGSKSDIEAVSEGFQALAP